MTGRRLFIVAAIAFLLLAILFPYGPKFQKEDCGHYRFALSARMREHRCMRTTLLWAARDITGAWQYFEFENGRRPASFSEIALSSSKMSRFGSICSIAETALDLAATPSYISIKVRTNSIRVYGDGKVEFYENDRIVYITAIPARF